MKELEKIRISKNPQIPRDFLWLKPDNNNYKMLVPQGSSWKEVELGGSSEGAVRYNEEQLLTEAQALMAQNNIGIKHIKITSEGYLEFQSASPCILCIVAVNEEECSEPLYVHLSTDSFQGVSSSSDSFTFEVWENDPGYLVLYGGGDTITYDISAICGDMPSIVDRPEPSYELTHKITHFVPSASPLKIDGTLGPNNVFVPSASYDESIYYNAVSAFNAGRGVMLCGVIDVDTSFSLSVISHIVTSVADATSYLVAILYSRADSTPRYIKFPSPTE